MSSKQKIPKNVVKVGAVGIIINENKKILLVKRFARSHEGYWALPAETLIPGETIQQTLIRGMREELGVEVEILKYTGFYYDSPGRDIRYKTAVDHPFICRIKKGKPTPKEESSQVKWFTFQELKKVVFPYDQKKMLNDAGIIS